MLQIRSGRITSDGTGRPHGHGDGKRAGIPKSQGFRDLHNLGTLSTILVTAQAMTATEDVTVGIAGDSYRLSWPPADGGGPRSEVKWCPRIGSES